MNNLEDYMDYGPSFQRAALDNITRNVREVYVDGSYPVKFNIIFFFDNEPSEDEEELASLTHTYMVSDFPHQISDFQVKHAPYPSKINCKGVCMYRRYENSV